MKSYDPRGTVAAAPGPKVTTKHRGFDFDSDEPVAGEIHKPDSGVMAWIIEWGIVADVVLGGWLLMDWWYHGAWVLMRHFMLEHAGALMRMIEFGQF